MADTKNLNWIGFQEAQKSISALKQEVEIAERKLFIAKKSFYKETKSKIQIKTEDSETSLKPTILKEQCKPSHFVLETVLPYPKEANFNNVKANISKELSFLTSEEEPNFIPTQYPNAEPIKLKHMLMKRTSDSFMAMSPSIDDDSIFSDAKCSSEGTSSLIAGTFRDAEKVFNRNNIKILKTPTEVFISNPETNINDETTKKSPSKMTSSDKDVQSFPLSRDMEWMPVTGKKSFSVQSRFEPDGIQKLQDIIEHQKKKQEKYQLQLEKQNYYQPSKYDRNEDDVSRSNFETLPLRKVRLVKSLPVYKGFSAPPNKFTSKRTHRPQKNKLTMVKPLVTENVDHVPRRIKKVVHSGNDFCPKESVNVKDTVGKKMEPVDEMTNDENIKAVPEEKQNDADVETSCKKVFEHVENETNDLSQIFADSLHSYDEKSINVVDGKELKDILIKNCDSSLKENKKPLKTRTIKRKANKLPEQKQLSPKLRHYDVEEVRNYIKKKKEERRKRHQDEQNKSLHQAQKRKQSLEKLYEYQKQNVKIVARVKPWSPIKILQKGESLNKECKNQVATNSPEFEYVTDMITSEINNVPEKQLSASVNVDGLKAKQNESLKKKYHADGNTYKCSKKNQENLHIDISMSKFVSEHATSLSAQKSNITTKLRNPSFLPLPREKCDERWQKKRRNSNKTTMQKDLIYDVQCENKINSNLNNEDVPDFFRSISSVSTPSELSHIVGISAEIIQEIKAPKISLPEKKSDKCEVLKDLIKSINGMTKPLESLLQVQKWVDDSPQPPDILQRKQSAAELVLNKHKNPSALSIESYQKSKQEPQSQRSSFMEAVADIGDVSQLYERILGKESVPKEPAAANDESLLSFQYESADDLIEGSLNLEEKEASINEKLSFDASIVSVPPELSSHFSDLQGTKVPDPFNLINTYSRKPLGLTIYDKKENTSTLVPSRFLDKNIELEEIYKSLFTYDQGDVSSLTSSYNTLKETKLSDFSHSVEQQPTGSPKTSTTARDKSYSSDCSHSVEKPPNVSNSCVLKSSHNLSFKKNAENMSSTSHSSCNNKSPEISIHSNFSSTVDKSSTLLQKLEKDKPLSVKDISNLSPKGESITVINDQNLDESKISASSYQSSQFESVKLSFSKSSVNTSSMLNNHIVINSEKQPQTTENSTLTPTDFTVTKENVVLEELENDTSLIYSEKLISGSIISQYSSVNDLEDNENKEIFPDKVSGSGSSVSEVISVVENSKGFQSSAEDKALSPSKLSNTSKHSLSQINKYLSSDGNPKIDPSINSADASAAIHSVVVSRRTDMSAPSIPSVSQTGIAVNYEQPLRWISSSGGLETQEDQYLHTQVVTRVATEAAAAAATSAVIAVFETQKALLSEKNYLGMINSCTRSNSKKTQYSSDFESSPNAKSSSSSSPYSAITSKQSKLVSENISENIGQLASNGESIEEKIESEASTPHKVSKYIPDKPIEAAESIASMHETVSKSQKPSHESKRKVSGNMSSPSPASLSDNDSVSSQTIMSSHSNFSEQSESALSDDSFAQLTLDVVRRMTHEEELRAKHQLSVLQFQEKSIVEKARAEMMWLELLKKRLKEKNANQKVLSIKHRQKELLLRLRHERTQLRCMQEAYRSICEKHHSCLEDKKKLLNEPRSLANQLLSKDGRSLRSNQSENKVNEILTPNSTVLSTSTIVSENAKTVGDEESVSEVPEISRGMTRNSSQESIIECQVFDHMKTSNSSENKFQQNSPSASYSPVNASHSVSSFNSSNSLETALQGLKKLEASKRHLSKREQRILQRRKQVENLLQWQMKLDSEEMAVRELELKALDLVDHSKKKIKYYVSSTGSTAQDDSKKSESMKECSNNFSKDSDNLPESAHESENKISQSTSEAIQSIPQSIKSEKNVKENSATADQSGSLPEEIKSVTHDSSVHTIVATENGSQMDESVPEETSYHVSSSSKEKSSSSDIYSESFESNTSQKTALANQHIKKMGGLGIRLPLVPRNRRRHDSSGSEDSCTISQSETASDQSDIEVRIQALAEELRRRKAEAEKLKKEHKKKYREQLKEKELSMQKQLEVYNQYIQQAQLELECQIESAISPPHSSDVIVKPRIKWPRPEQIIDSRKVRKQPVLPPDLIALEKISEHSSHSIEIAQTKGKPTSKTFHDSSLKNNDDNIIKDICRKTSVDSIEIPEESTVDSKDISDKLLLDSKEISENFNVTSHENSTKSTFDSKEISDILSQNDSSETHDVSETEHSQSIISEIFPEFKLSAESNENISNTSSSLTINDKNKSDSYQKSTISSADESKGSDESKSQTDTFISESSSLKISENNISKNTQSLLSNKTIFSEEDISFKLNKDDTKDLNRNVDNDNKILFHETGSSYESTSEVPSEICPMYSEESENEDSKCGSSEGCEPFPLQFTDQKLGTHSEDINLLVKSVELDAKESIVQQSYNNVSVCNKKKLVASEPIVLNIINYLSASLVEDTFMMFFGITRQKGQLGQFINSKSSKKNIIDQVEKDYKKLVETFTNYLLDIYLKDSLIEFFKILYDIKKNSALNVNHEASNKQNTNDHCLKVSNNIIVELFPKVGENAKFIGNNSLLSQVINDHPVFTTKQANWGVDSFVSSPKEPQNHFQFLEQQLTLQHYSYYYRKIPNKPPPPYTPPASNAMSLASSDGNSIAQKITWKNTSVKEITKNIDEVVELIFKSLMEETQKGFSLSKLSPPIKIINEKFDFSIPHQIVFVDLIFDLTKEIVLEQYNEIEEEPKPWLRSRRLTPKPLFLNSRANPTLIKKEMKKTLKLDVSNNKLKKQTWWSSMKLGRKKRDFVDTILISELKDEEPDWLNYDQDEMTVKLQIADSIFNSLIEDTVNWVKSLELKIAS